MGIDVPLARFTRRIPRFRGWHRLLEPLRRHFVKVYQGRPDRWIVIEDFEGDLRFRVDRAAYMSSVIYWRGIHSYGEASLIRRFLPSDGVFLDVGANQGELTLVAARRAPHGRVIAFEPIPQWFALLSENVRLNGLEHVTLVPVALSSREDTLEMFTSDDVCLHASFHEGLSTFHRTTYRDVPVGRFPTVPLDLYSQREGLTRVDMIKIDVEGAERAVLEGARATLDRLRPTLILELNEETFGSAGYSSEAIAQPLRSMGYTLFHVDPFARITPVADRPLASFGTLLARHENGL